MADTQITRQAEPAAMYAANDAAASKFHEDISPISMMSKANELPKPVSNAAEVLPTASVSPAAIDFAPSKGMEKTGVTCRWIDDSGNSGLGDCDMAAGTVRKY